MRVGLATLMREWSLFESVGLVEQLSKANIPPTTNKYLINDFICQ